MVYQTPLAWIAVALYIITFVLFCSLHIANSNYNVLRNPVSDYGVGRTTRFFQLYALSGTLAAVALTSLFYLWSYRGFPSLIAICLLLMVVSRLGVVLFPTDLEGQKRSRRGRLHYLFAIGTFCFAYTAIANATEPAVALYHAPVLDLLLVVFKYVALIALAATVITMARPLRHFFGLCERVFIVSTIVWFLTMSLWFVSTGGK
jgi:hypothetical protein